MSTDTPTYAGSDFSIDSEKQTIGSAVKGYLGKVKSGDLGAFPALLSIVVLGAIFAIARPETFTTRRNFANLLQQAAHDSVGLTFEFGMPFSAPAIWSARGCNRNAATPSAAESPCGTRCASTARAADCRCSK